MIVVTTPTGAIGSGLLARLLDAGAPVRVVVRDPDRLPEGTRERVEVVTGSHADREVLDRALPGADALFWLVPPDLTAEDAAEHYRRFTRPAAAAVTAHGVPRVVAVSSLGRGHVLDEESLVWSAYAMDDLLEATGAHYRSLRMPAFMEDALIQRDSILDRGVFYGSQDGATRTPWVATDDIAAAAADLLLDGSWRGQGSRPVLGPEDLGVDDIAAVLADVLGRPVRYQRLSPDEHRQLLEDHGMGRAYARGIVGNQAAADAGAYGLDQRTTLTASPTTFRQWCTTALADADASGR